MNSLGERIKQLRKQKKMTLAELAGDRLTKGMLSLIENGKAQPSMESLKYIAEQMGVEVAVLLNDGNVEELRSLLVEIEEEYNTVTYPFDVLEKDKFLRMHGKISAKKDQLQGRNYEEIRLLDYFIRFHIILNYEQEETTMFDIIALYEKMNAYSRIVDCYTFLSGMAFYRNDYKIALQFMQDAEKRIEPYLHLIDKLSILDLHYVLAMLYAAIDDSVHTQKHLDAALEFAHKHKIYYRLDEFYRFIFIQAIGQGDKEKCEYYLLKLTQHAAFTEDFTAQCILVFARAHFSNQIEKDYMKVFTYKDSLPMDIDEEILKDSLTLYLIEETYAHWILGNFQQALDCSESITIPGFAHHPVDLSLIYKSFAIRALCYYELGNKDAAKSEILYAYHGVAEFPSSIYKTFIQNAYEKIQYGKRVK